MTRAAQPAASDVDRGFEPARAEVGTRRAVAINYHFVRSRNGSRFRLRAHERPERFEQQLARLAREFRFCRVRDLVDPERDLPASNIVLTFDDGAKDVAEEAVPLLQRHAATATVFVCAQPYLDGRLLEIQKIEFLMRELSLARFRKAFYAELERQFPKGVEREPLDFAGGYRFYRYDEAPIREFKLDINYRLPYANVIPVLDALFTAVFGEGSEAVAVRETYMSVDDLKRLFDGGFELGVHTAHHWVLPRLDFEAQKREIQTGVEFLRETTGQTQFAVAYPFGFHDDRTRTAMEELDLLAGLTTGRRMIEPEDIRARWSLPRYDVNDCFDRRSNEIIHEVFAKLSTGPGRSA
jgi:peptidoglycan/xylan/chitin deacetylase (PgdA/CDA1 family)